MFIYQLMLVGSSPAAVTETSDFAPASSKDFLNIQAARERGFTLKRINDMIRAYIQGNVMLVKVDWAHILLKNRSW